MYPHSSNCSSFRKERSGALQHWNSLMSWAVFHVFKGRDQEEKEGMRCTSGCWRLKEMIPPLPILSLVESLWIFQAADCKGGWSRFADQKQTKVKLSVNSRLWARRETNVLIHDDNSLRNNGFTTLRWSLVELRNLMSTKWKSTFKITNLHTIIILIL